MQMVPTLILGASPRPQETTVCELSSSAHPHGSCEPGSFHPSCAMHTQGTLRVHLVQNHETQTQDWNWGPRHGHSHSDPENVCLSMSLKTQVNMFSHLLNTPFISLYLFLPPSFSLTFSPLFSPQTPGGLQEWCFGKIKDQRKVIPILLPKDKELNG